MLRCSKLALRMATYCFVEEAGCCCCCCFGSVHRPHALVHVVCMSDGGAPGCSLLPWHLLFPCAQRATPLMGSSAKLAWSLWKRLPDPLVPLSHMCVCMLGCMQGGAPTGGSTTAPAAAPQVRSRLSRVACPRFFACAPAAFSAWGTVEPEA